MKHRIYYDDIIYSIQKRGGISTYWKYLTAGIEKDPAFDVVRLPRSLYPRIMRYIPVMTPTGGNKGLFHSSYYRLGMGRKMRSVVTVHDFVYERYRSGLARLVHSQQKSAAIRNAWGILCVSQSTRRDLELYYGSELSGKVVETIPLGVHGQAEKPAEQSPLPRAIVPGAYVLYVGPRSGYKNFAVLECLASNGALDTRGLSVVCVGGEPRQQSPSTPARTGSVFYLSDVSDEQLASLYRHAYALVYTSKYEGFGLPLLEAMRYDCPVIAADVSSLPEVGGDAALYFPAEDSERLLACIDRLQDAEVRRRLVSLGADRVTAFTWDAVIQKTAAFYRRVLQS